MKTFLSQILLFLLFAQHSQAFSARPQPFATRSSSSTSLCAKKVFVAGGSKGVGRHIIDKLLDSDPDTSVVALVRDPQVAKELEETYGVSSMKAVVGDAFDQKTVENAMDGCDAAVTTLGGVNADDGRRVDYEGNNNVIESAGILGVTRVILVTSIGCGSSKGAVGEAVFEQLKEALAAKERAENVLIKYYTNMNWTIIRPGGLISEAATGKAILTEDNMAIGSIHREDVASLVVRALDSAATERKILSAIDPSIASHANQGKEFEAYAL